MINMQELNKKLQTALLVLDPSVNEVLAEICTNLEENGAIKVLAKAMFLRSAKLDLAGHHQEARDAYIQALEVLFKGGFSDSFIDITTRPSMAPSDLRSIAGLEALNGAHDFVLAIDCDVPMFPWASAAVDSMKDFFKSNENASRASYKFLFLASDKNETPFSRDSDTNFARLQILTLPMAGRPSIASVCTKGYLDKLSWPGFRKTAILVLNEADLTPSSLRTVDSKRFLEKLNSKLIKIHVIACGSLMTDETRKAIEFLVDQTGGLLLRVEDPGDVGQAMQGLIAGELGQPFNLGDDDLTRIILEKEASISWQWN